jgi:hypothetical protein
VTRWVSEKVAQNVAQCIFMSKFIQTFFPWKQDAPKTTQRKQLPNRRKFSQSGRPPCTTLRDSYLSLPMYVLKCPITYVEPLEG